MTELEMRLKAHDFYHAWSEDQAAFARGADERKELIQAMKSLPMREVVRLVSTFVPRELREEWVHEVSTPKVLPWLR